MFVWLLFLLLPRLYSASLEAVSDEQELKVATYNIRVASKWALKDGGDANGRRTWRQRSTRVAEQISISKAWVVGLQEALDQQVAELIGLLGAEWRRVGGGRLGDGSDSDETATIIYDSTKIHLLETGDFWLSETPEIVGSQSWGASLPRVATWAAFRRRQRTFVLLNTHFDHASAKARLKSAALVRERVGDFERLYDFVFVTGDFNADKSQAWHTELTRDGAMFDTWTKAVERSCGACGRSTYHAWRGSFDSTDALSGKDHIDGVYASRKAADFGVFTFARMLTDDRRRGVYGGPFASDHYLVVATFRLFPIPTRPGEGEL